MHLPQSGFIIPYRESANNRVARYGSSQKGFGEGGPGEVRLYFSDVFGEGVRAFGIEGADGVGKGFSADLFGHYADAGAFDAFGQAAYGRGHDGDFEVEGDAGNAALRGAFVGQHAHVGGGEETGDFVVVDVAVEDLDVGAQARGCDPRFVFVEFAVALAGDDQLVAFAQQGQGVDQQVEALVVADQAEKEQRSKVGIEEQFFPRRELVGFLAEMVVERMGFIDLAHFDYIKTGPYVASLGGLKSPTTNQRLYRVTHPSGEETPVLEDITYRFLRK